MRLCSIGLLNGRGYCWLLLQNPVGGAGTRPPFNFTVSELASGRGVNCRMESRMVGMTMMGVMYKEVVEVPNRSSIEYWVQWDGNVGSKSLVLWSVLI